MLLLSVNSRKAPILQTKYANRGIIFGPDDNVPFITSDPSNPTSPVLSGRPIFMGAIEGKFVNPDDGVSPITVSAFSLDAGVFDAIGSTRIEWFDLNDNKLGEQFNSNLGIQRFDIGGYNIARWRIAIVASEPQGFAIDNLKIDFSSCDFRKIDDVNDDDCVEPDHKITYTITYELKDTADSNVRIIDYLPAEVDYNSSPGGDYNAVDRTVRWNLGPLNLGAAGSVGLSVIVNGSALPGHTIVNVANLVGDSHFRIAEANTFICYSGGIEPNVICVDKDANGGLNNGTSWDNAFTDFNDALREAQITLKTWAVVKSGLRRGRISRLMKGRITRRRLSGYLREISQSGAILAESAATRQAPTSAISIIPSLRQSSTVTSARAGKKQITLLPAMI